METTTVIKRGLARLSKDKHMTALLETYVRLASRIACEASLLANLHVTRLVIKSKAVPPLSQTFFSRCLASIANLGIGRRIRAKDKDLFESVQVSSLLLPGSYEPIERATSLAVVLENIAQQTRENLAVSVSVNFFSRVRRWFRLKIQERSSSTATTYFSDNESQITRSLISLLLRASTQDEPSLGQLALQYSRLQQYPIPCAEMRWLQSLVNEVRSKIPLPLNLSEKPHSYLPFLYFVLQEIEKHNQNLDLHDQKDPRAIKQFALLPQKKLRQLNIKISNTVLKELNKELSSYSPHFVDMPVRNLRNHYFDIEKSTDLKTKKFNHFVVTDGVSASMNLVRRQRAPLQTREERSVDALFAQADRVVAVDPGRNPVFTAVVHDRKAMHDLAKPYPRNKVKHKVVTWSRSQWHSETGYTHRRNLTKRWMEKAPEIAEFNSEVSTAKTTNLSAIQFHARHVLSYFPAVLDFYCARRFRRLRWETEIRSQKAINKIVRPKRRVSEGATRLGGRAIPNSSLPLPNENVTSPLNFKLVDDINSQTNCERTQVTDRQAKQSSTHAHASNAGTPARTHSQETMGEELYASPISQPSRAVHWLCKIHDHPIEYKYTDSGKGATRTESFLQMNPVGKIPVLKDGEFVLTESHAIMIYLSDKHGWEKWCPKDLKTRARINEYMNWHHHNARRSSEIFINQFFVNIGRSKPSIEAALKRKDATIADIFRIMEFWLRHGNHYLVSATQPTVVDLSCYNEVVQLEVMGLLTDVDSKFPLVGAWLKRMKNLPFHDEMMAPMIKFFTKFKLAKL